jgi:succinoglycan biosynthesis transport protein ExoP
VIGYVAKMDYPAGTPRGMFVVKQPRSPVAEAFRSLRTNLEFSSVDTPLRTILVTSPNPGEGKTTIAVNLAGIIAQGGKSVILLDTDMRRPQVHQFFDLPNRLGFSELFRNNLPFRAVGQEMEGLKDAVVIPSGNPPPNPTELLSSNRMTQVLDQLKAAVDVVVLDSPPSMVADAQVLASKVDGVILIIHPAHTHADAALASVDQMKRAGARILGVVLNRIPRNHSSYYGGYRYYLPYYNHYQPAPKEPAATRTKKSGLQPRKRLQVLSGFFKGLSSWMANRRARTPRLSRFSLTGRSAGLFSGKSKVN